MKKNTLFILILVVLALIASYFLFNNQFNTISSEDSDFAVQDTSNITRIFMADKKNKTLDLSRLNQSEWLINGRYPANPPAMQMLLKTLYNIDVVHPVSKSSYDVVIARLASSAIKVEIYQQVYRINLFDRIKLFPHEKLTKVYYVGDATQNNLGTYMIKEGSDMPFVVNLPGFRGFVSSRYTLNEQDWRDHTIFAHRIPEIAEVQIDFHDDPAESYIVKNIGNSLSLIPQKTGLPLPLYDTLKLYNMMNEFASIKYESLLNDLVDSVKKDSIINSKPFHTIRLIDNAGDTVEMTTFHKVSAYETWDVEQDYYIWDRDRMYALINDGQDFVLVQFFVFDKILRPLSFFMVDDELM